MLKGLSAREFLARHWQRKALLVRQAFPGFQGLLSAAEMMDLAGREELRSRLVLRQGERWEVRHGPFAPSVFRRLPLAGWTLLVQDVNLLVPEAAQLLANFRFLSYARLDDLMVSLAPPGGGVGPHFDSYDVFLLQGPGRRRWQVSRQRDRRLVEDAPIRLLREFKPTQEWVLDAGDMLYLPPGYAHDGVAVDTCMTYSIGFRAPAWQELAAAFLADLADQVDLPGRFGDAGVAPRTEPARLPADLVDDAVRALARVRWSGPEVARFLGRHLTEPKAHVFFSTPSRPLSAAAFSRRIARHGVALALPTQMLYGAGRLFVNGEELPLAGLPGSALQRLANDRHLSGADVTGQQLDDLLYAWYRSGYLLPEAASGQPGK